MQTAQQSDIRLAEGFHFTDHLTSPYQIAYGHINCSGRAVYVSNVDGSEVQQLLDEATNRQELTMCFSPDGTTLYGHDTNFWAKDLETGKVRTLPPVPLDAQAPG